MILQRIKQCPGLSVVNTTESRHLLRDVGAGNLGTPIKRDRYLN